MIKSNKARQSFRKTLLSLSEENFQKFKKMVLEIEQKRKSKIK